MAHDSIDWERAHTLGRAVGTYSHDELPAAQIDELDELTTDIDGALEGGAETQASEGLLGFWVGHVTTETGRDGETETTVAPEQLFEEGFETGTLGVDLYQALSKVVKARETDSSPPDLAAWTDRLFELTNRHVAHLQSHQGHN